MHLNQRLFHPNSTFPVIALVCLAMAFATNVGSAQVVGSSEISGTILAVTTGEITIKQSDDKVATHKIQDKGQRAITIAGRRTNAPAKIKVTGSIPAKLIQKGMFLKFTANVTLSGKTDGEIETFQVISGDASDDLKVEFLEQSQKNSQPAKCEIIGRVISFSGKKLQLQVPKGKWARKERMNFKVADESVLQINDDNLKRVLPNDIASRVLVLELESGETVVRAIEISMAAKREELEASFNQKLDQEFGHLSDEPAKEPRELRSDHFVLYTDISERSSSVLLAKLETMYELIGKYFGSRSRQPIECYVVHDIKVWPEGSFEPTALNKILEPAGVTLSRSNRARGLAKAIVYSCDDHGVVQHEAVHAFCVQTFGSTGPVWYSEGMAEMGQYWKPGKLAVDINPAVINYLTNAEPKKMSAIVAAGQITGDSWQAYSWRWALCHLLASNPNYSKRFKKLGINLMAEQEDSFERAYGEVALEISFEYDQFVQNFGNGYRVDLCSWEWKPCSNLSSNKKIKQDVEAKRGWQATKLQTRADVSYDFAGVGKWKLTAGNEELTADGDGTGRGQLIGAILKDYQLSEPFELGEKGSFVAQTDGQLYVRCRDKWNSLQDNQGEITLHLRRTKKEKPAK